MKQSRLKRYENTNDTHMTKQLFPKDYMYADISDAPKLRSAQLSLDSAQAGCLSAWLGSAHTNFGLARVKNIC